MNQSEQIGEIASALAKAQAEIFGAIRDSKNPFFKSSYADLASVWAAIRDPMTKNGLAVVQTVEQEGNDQYLVTKLVHSSGQWFSGRIKIISMKIDMQSMGGAITYARRYGLAAIMGVPQVDDDGNLATHGKTHKPEKPQQQPPQKSAPQGMDYKSELMRVITKVTDGFKNKEAVQAILELWDTDSAKDAMACFESEGMLKEKYEELVRHFGIKG